MATTWTTLLDGTAPKNELDLVKLSDKLWETGTLDEIQKTVSPEVFQIFIAMNTFGNWENEGWGCLIGDLPELVPYIAEALEFVGLPQIAGAFHDVMTTFPDFAVFTNDENYCDVVNFLQNTRFKVKDPRLLQYSKEQRKEMSRRFCQGIDHLEVVTESLWDSVGGWSCLVQQVCQYGGVSTLGR